MIQQRLLTVSLCPREVHFRLPGGLQKYPIIDTPSVFEIEHQYGKLAIEAREQTLSLRWGPTEEPPPNISITVSHIRADDSLYYPEFLIPLPGYALVSRKAN